MNFLFFHVAIQFINNLSLPLSFSFFLILYLIKIGTAFLGRQSQCLLILNQQHFLFQSNSVAKLSHCVKEKLQCEVNGKSGGEDAKLIILPVQYRRLHRAWDLNAHVHNIIMPSRTLCSNSSYFCAEPGSLMVFFFFSFIALKSTLCQAETLFILVVWQRKDWDRGEEGRSEAFCFQLC